MQNRNTGLVALIIAVSIFLFFLIAYLGSLIGYFITAADSAALFLLILMLALSIGDISRAMTGHVNIWSLASLALLLLFFLAVAIQLLPQTELIYFDENIYQAVALNILHSGNALSCIYGTAYVKSCFSGQLGFDPAGWPLLIAIAYAVFGINNGTSYGLELFLGCLYIVSVFLLSSLLTKRKELATVSAAVLALTPELFIWSKTLANPDLSFATFTALSSFLFIVFTKTKTKKTFALFSFCLAFTIYLRVEAILLVPVFALLFLGLGESGIRTTFRERFALVVRYALDKKVLLLIFVFIILIEPELYTMIATTPELQANAAFYLYSNTPIFSPSYLLQNTGPNISFLAGQLNDYPIIFLPSITAFAIIGTASLFLQRLYRNRFGILLLLLSIFFFFFIFYLIYFSGSVLVGDSVRYFLVLYAPMAVLSGFGILASGDWFAGILHKRNTNYRYLIYSLIIALFFVLPFVYISPTLINPTFTYYGFPVNRVTANLSGINPYTTQYAKKSLDFVESNYNVVPSNCLVLSETPSVWFMLNRSSSYMSETDIFTNASYSNYSCYYLDYSFWCTVSPYNTTVCSYYTENYKLKPVATESSGRSANFTIYRVLNYT